MSWRKARASQGCSNCVEVSPLADGGVAVRDSKAPDGLTLAFTAPEWAAFLAGVRDGEFDQEALRG
ncbi:DUF397 domain-containing protein [Nonomuraea sp. NPDC023979]|uniref:DUF397 domain-containing protein n=1 Tax=Nonomuraea sp. NPDC023979 TaxID=3154796 RepID=UPI0033D9031B